MFLSSRKAHRSQQRRTTLSHRQDVPPALVEDSEDSDDDCQHKRPTHKKQHARRHLWDQLRLYLLTGRSSRAFKATILAALLGASLAVFSYNVPVLLVVPAELTAKPVMVGIFFTDVSSDSFMGKVQRIEPPRSHDEWMELLQNRLQHHHHSSSSHHRRRHDEILPGLVEPMSDHLPHIETDSEDYDRKPQNTPHPEQCEPQYEWQTKSFPVCNNLHEHSILSDRLFWGSTSTQHNHQQQRLRRRLVDTMTQREPVPHYQLLAHGYWRDAWLLQQPYYDTNNMERVALKTMRFEHDYTEIVYDKQRRDALTSDRLQFSDHAIHLYAYCGTAALYDYAPGGDLTRFLNHFETAEDWRNAYTPAERFVLAYNVTAALADLHTTENDDGNSAIVHADFNANQFVAVQDGGNDNQKKRPIPQFKLGDFNLAKFVYYNRLRNHPCTVQTEGSGGNWRAPEEYLQRGRTEKLDIYSLGNLLYVILTGQYPFENVKPKQTRELVAQGQRPTIDDSIRHSHDPYIQALLSVIDLCWKQDPHDRPSAPQVKHKLEKHLPPDLVGEHHPHHGHHRRQGNRHWRQ